MKAGLAGFGYWGRNVARTCRDEGIDLVSICDRNPERLREAEAHYPASRLIEDFGELLPQDLDAILIAVPPSDHYRLAKAALLAGKHVFVEKPFTTSLDHAYELLDLADRKGLIALVDHVFVYAEPVRYLKEMIQQGRFGELVYINSRRINLGLFQQSVDVVWDLAVHDLSIIDYLVGLDIRNVAVFKRKYNGFPNDAMANISFELTSGTVGSIWVSWLSPVKVREMTLGGTEMTAIFDDTKPDKLSVYDSGVVIKSEMTLPQLYSSLVQYKYGETRTPRLERRLSLNNALHHFRACVEDGHQPETGRDSIINVTRALEIIAGSA